MMFEVPGKPVPKARPRLGRNGSVYTPATTTAFEKTVARYAKAAGVKPASGPISLEIVSEFSIPKTWTKARKSNANGQPHMCRPDLDNLTKSVLDGLNGIAFADDAQVYCVTHRKIRSADCGPGRTIVRIIE
ncbi:RusA family crossover junction endodeoxyribonuclease [Paenirhodobacter populi]|uniref:RusA family crossover junction endodeoxyribonuclease n=1 Tax=Paenirhodobacter populi TaxID=2306993 RepID=A0A443J0C0_9RHOB|nr:RusA family crossover junction endodeoxyribonuclease [Sinirhodobacter populi]